MLILKYPKAKDHGKVVNELGSSNLDQVDVAGVTVSQTKETGTSRLRPLRNGYVTGNHYNLLQCMPVCESSPYKRRRIQPPVHKSLDFV